jgi:hypothetical protein
VRASDRRPPEVCSAAEAWEVRAATVAGSRRNLRAVPFRLTPAANRAQAAAQERRRIDAASRGEAHWGSPPDARLCWDPTRRRSCRPRPLSRRLLRAFALLVGPPSGINASITKSTTYFNPRFR